MSCRRMWDVWLASEPTMRPFSGLPSTHDPRQGLSKPVTRRYHGQSDGAITHGSNGRRVE